MTEEKEETSLELDSSLPEIEPVLPISVPQPTIKLIKTVEECISNIEQFSKLNDSIIGLDCEFMHKPISTKSANHKTALLQISNHKICLLIHLVHLEYIPWQLHKYLNDPK